MKKTAVFILSLVTIPVYGISVLESLNKYQSDLSGSVSSAPSGSPSKPVTESRSVTNNKCEENDQKSLPLSYLTSLILKKDGRLEIAHDPRNSTLSISSADMISNCSSMLDWKQRKQELNGKIVYSVEVKFKEGDSCSADGCTYKVAKVEEGDFKSFEEMRFPPTLKGFESCLQKSGVIANGKVNAGAIYSQPINERFEGIDDSGDLLFLSHGPSTALVKAKYGKFEAVDKCDYYENIQASPVALLNLRDENLAKKNAEKMAVLDAAKKDCNDYGKVADFIEKYEDFSAELLQVRDQSILDAVKKAAQKISEGKYTDEDLKVLADFEKYIVQPRIDLAVIQYNEMLDLEGDAKKVKQAELQANLQQIAAFNKKPFLTPEHLNKLVVDGKFDDAEKLADIQLIVKTHQRLGAKEGNKVITPELARASFVSGKSAFLKELASKKETYAITHGEVTGISDVYFEQAKRHRQAINIRTQNFTEEIQYEYSRIQPGGHCYLVNGAANCFAKSQERIQALMAEMDHYNKVDAEIADEKEAEGNKYAKLEAEGRRYVASQNGEEPEPANAPSTVPAAPQVTPSSPRVTDNSTYTFQYNPGPVQQPIQQPMQQPNYMPQIMSQMFNPMMYQQQQYMGMPTGQFGAGFNLGFGSSFGSGMPYQQPYMGQSQFGYWNQPYSAYNNYSMYGGFR